MRHTSSISQTTRRDFLKAAAVTTAAASLPATIHAQQPIQQHSGQGVQWITTTEAKPWQTGSPHPYAFQWDALDVRLLPEPAGPAVQGFGACFNELGWDALNKLSPADRDGIMADLFSPGQGANFTLCRMPIGANDFSRGWYSYDEIAEDFALQHFSIGNDQATLVPFIHAAQKHQPKLRLWASPWSPPQWMKTNRFYAEAQNFPGWPPNGIQPDQLRHEGQDVFIQDERYFKTYAEYFGKFIDSYRQNGIRIEAVMPQNEFNSAQPFPSCTWTPEGLAKFIRHLGPAMQQRDVQVFFGTLERGNPELLNHVLSDPGANRWIKGVGMQWAGKGAIRAVHMQHPELSIWASEQECGDGKNEWSYAGYCWRLMKHYFDDGASAYMYWNLALETGGKSHWGWPQNSLVTVDAAAHSFRYNHEYYVLKHASRFVQNGARSLPTDGTCTDLLAFQNPDGSHVLTVRNELKTSRPLDVLIGTTRLSVTLDPDSIGTLVVPAA